MPLTQMAIATARALEGCEIWLAFGHGKNFRYIAANTIAAELGDDWCKGFLFMHAFSSCDTVSSFSGIGKKTAWDVWRSSPNQTALFSRLSQTPEEVTDSNMGDLWCYCTAVHCKLLQ